MPRTILRRPSPAMAVAVTALFGALGGSGYAAATITATDVGASRAGHANSAQTVTSESFRFLAEFGAPTRTILDFGGVTIRAGCGSGDLDVRVDMAGPGQLQSASTHTTDKDEDAYNETVGVFDGPSVDVLPARDNDQLGHTEVVRQNGGSVSLTWQADNPSPGWKTGPGTTTTHQCVFTGNAVSGG